MRGEGLARRIRARHLIGVASVLGLLPRSYRRTRASLIAANGGLLYDGYADVARRYLLTPHDSLLHPQHRAASPEVHA